MKKIILLIPLILVFGSGGLLLGFDQAAVEQLLRTKRCYRCDLYKANLDNLDLRGADLRNANLKRAKFRKATLLGADLSGANIYGTNFVGAMWTDGSICQPGSVGKCVKKTE